MLSTQWHMGEHLFDPVSLPFDAYVVGHKVGIYVKIPRLRKDGSISEREYETFVVGTIERLTPKMVWVRWSFWEAVGVTANSQSGLSLVQRDKVYE
jgi:hypothetical protein